MNLKTGHQLAGGRYRVERVLGQGGFGITYLAEQVSLGRKVAVKEFFMKELCNREGDTSHVTVPSIGSREMVDRFRDKFIKEARTLAKLRHRHIVRIIDVFEENGTAYYVMEHIGGGSLGDKVKSGALPESDAVRYIRQVASALDFVHSRRMMHLDVKPANILLNDDEAVLIDFGLAKQYDTQGSQTSTTPVGISHGYAPMEQYKRGGVGTFSPATDIYSLGATLYKLVTGNTPPEASDVNDDGLPELPANISSPVRRAVEAAMQPRRKDRPQSIGEFLEIVESGKMKDDSDGVEDCPPAFRGTSAAEGVNDSPSTDDGETVVGNSSGSCHPERSEGTYKHANKEILPPSGRQNDNGGKMRDESGEWRDERKRLGGTSKKRWAIIIAVLVIGAVAALLGTLSGGGSDDTAAERERLAAIAEEQRIEAERLASEQQRLEQERLAQEAAEQQRLESERKAKEEAERKAAAEAAEKKHLEQERLAAERKAAEQKRKEEERKRLEAAQTRGTINGHEWVDLGLSVKWATCNVGASSPGDYGRYYAWGETTTKSDYSEANSTTYGKQMTGIAGNSTYDVARREWGGTWRLPTKKEFQKLIDNCTWTWTTQNGHDGYKVTSKKNGNSIFLPADRSHGSKGALGNYWSATPYESGTRNAYGLGFYHGNRWVFLDERYDGHIVRPVCE